MAEEIRALIFDLDGVITDTVELHYRSWIQLAGEVGLPIPADFRNMLRGVSRRESLKRLLNGHSVDEETAQEWMRRKNMYYLAFIAFLTPEAILPGVTAILDDADRRGIKKAVASSSMNAKFVLRKLGLFDRMDAISDTSMIPRAKPEPDLFMWAAGRLGVLPSESVVFEDASDGVQAARSGGFWVVGLGDLALEKAHVRYPDLSEISLDEILKAVAALQ
ncbi:MAG: beta-phosphoglucomutase [Anaerolineae bacterium]|nr:beta-phosphoglucomutase [Anaerolineae bacterium]NUQ04141.1 beta-phosphoglucomutase [Anaerolineae bacterium]